MWTTEDGVGPLPLFCAILVWTTNKDGVVHPGAVCTVTVVHHTRELPTRMAWCTLAQSALSLLCTILVWTTNKDGMVHPGALRTVLEMPHQAGIVRVALVTSQALVILLECVFGGQVAL